MNNRFDSNFSKLSKRMDDGFKFFWIIWAITALVGLSMAGVIIWAIIRLVTKYS